LLTSGRVPHVLVVEDMRVCAKLVCMQVNPWTPTYQCLNAPTTIWRDALLTAMPCFRFYPQLRNLNCTYVHAENGSVAVDLLRNAAPGEFSLVLMDVRMPIMNGYEATRAILYELKLLSLPIVAVSGEGGEETEEHMASCGFSAFFSKLISRQQIRVLVSTYSSSTPPEYTPTPPQFKSGRTHAL